MYDALISIIVPIYNVERYLDRCMQSLICQTYENIEIIMVDDGSLDRCPIMCDEYMAKDSRIKVVHKKNAGLGYARNSGLDVATGDYIIFVDSDDYVSNDMCEKLYATSCKYDADVVYGNIFHNANGKITLNKSIDRERSWRGEEEIRDLLLDFIATKPEYSRDTMMEVSVWKALFRRSIFDQYGIRFVSERQFISEDIIFDIDFLICCKCVAVIPDPVYYYCINPNSLSKSFRSDRFLKVKELYCEIIRKLSELYTEEVYQERTDRFLIARARTNARQIVHHQKMIGKRAVCNGLKMIYQDDDLVNVLKRYPIAKLPLKYAFIAYLMKIKSSLLLRMVLKW